MYNSDLWFEGFDVYHVAIPVFPGHGVASNLNFGALPISIVVGQTNQGFEAIGEAFRADSIDAVERTLRGLLRVPLNKINPSTLWMKDTYETGFVGGMTRTKALSSWEDCGMFSVALMESLWLDAVGKSTHSAAHVLLGGAVRREVKVDYWASQPSACELYELVLKASSLGCRGMKLKSNREGNTVHSIKAIEKDLPDGFQFTIDPMFNWRSLHESRKILKVLCQLDVPIKVEDPFPFEAISDWQLAKQQYPITLIWHTRSEEDLRIALREEAADVFNVACRCAHEAVYLAKVLAFHSKDCWFGSQLETGIFQQVRLHSASVAPTCVLACDLQSQWIREHTLINPPMVTKEGVVPVSDLPGLGVELDHKALNQYTIDRRRIG